MFRPKRGVSNSCNLDLQTVTTGLVTFAKRDSYLPSLATVGELPVKERFSNNQWGAKNIACFKPKNVDKNQGIKGICLLKVVDLTQT